MRTTRIIATIALLSLFATSPMLATAQDSDGQLLDGTEIEYMYPDGGTVIVNFYDGKLRYRWTAGPFAGTEVADQTYRSREIRDGLYLVNWHDTENSNFGTLVIDVQENALYSSALAGYGTDQEMTLFDRAAIERVDD